METYTIPRELRHLGYTEAAVISYKKGDFSAAATTQSYNAFTLAAGDILTYPMACLRVKTGVTGITTPTAIVGHSGDDDFLIASQSIATTGFTAIPVAVSAAAGGPMTSATGTGIVIVKLTSGSENWSAATAGELIVYAAIHRATHLDSSAV